MCPVVFPFGGIFGVCQVDEFLVELDHGGSGSVCGAIMLSRYKKFYVYFYTFLFIG